MADGRCYCPFDGREIAERFYASAPHRRWHHSRDLFPSTLLGC